MTKKKRETCKDFKCPELAIKKEKIRKGIKQCWEKWYCLAHEEETSCEEYCVIRNPKGSNGKKKPSMIFQMRKPRWYVLMFRGAKNKVNKLLT